MFVAQPQTNFVRRLFIYTKQNRIDLISPIKLSQGKETMQARSSIVNGFVDTNRRKLIQNKRAMAKL